MKCPQCGKLNEVEARFCSACGSVLNSFSTSAPISRPIPVKSIAFKVGCVLIGFIFVVLLAVGGLMVSIFYGIKKSESNQIAVAALKQNPEAQAILGNIEKIGWPVGNISVQGGGSGNASFSMSVQGSKTRGKYYATLARTNGIWTLQSSRVQLADGKSYDLSGETPPPSPALSPSSLPSGGRQLRPNASALGSLNSIEWTEDKISLRIPQGWEQTKLDNQGFEFRAPDRSAYFFGNAVSFHQTIPFVQLMSSFVQKSQGQLRDGEISGYSLKTLGAGQGLLQIQRHGDGSTSASWEGYANEGGETKSYTFVMGTSSEKDFDRCEGAFGALFDSIKIP